MIELRVYGWQGNRKKGTTHGQSWEIVAAKSLTEAVRIAGVPRSRVSVVWDAREAAVALAEPGTVFWRDLDSQMAGWNR